MEPDMNDVPPVLLPCPTCARTFKQDSLEKHTKICQRQAAKKRKPFDSAKQRIQGTDLAEFLPKQGRRRTTHEDKPSNSNGTWKQTHDEFLRAIRAARGDADDQPSRQPEKGRQKVSTALAAPTRGYEKGTCPTCNRQFGIKAYDRHVAWCKERANRLPVNSATTVAKERLEARMRYRAPVLRNRRAATREKYSPSSATGLTGTGTGTGTGIGTGRTSASGSTSRLKESSSVPVCNDPQKSKPTVGRRSIQTRESLLRTGPVKSRLSDRMTKRPKEEEIEAEEEAGCKSLRSTRRTSQIPSNLPISPRKFRKLAKIQSPLKSAGRSRDPIPKFKANHICAKGFENPKLNDVSINDDVVCMMVRQCNIYRSDDLVTWKQIGEIEKSKIQDIGTADDFEDFENSRTNQEIGINREFHSEEGKQRMAEERRETDENRLIEKSDILEKQGDNGYLLLKETENFSKNFQVDVIVSSSFRKLKCLERDFESDLEAKEKVQKLNQTYLIKESDDIEESFENVSSSLMRTVESPKKCISAGTQIPVDFEIQNEFQLFRLDENSNGSTGWSGGLKIPEQKNRDLVSFESKSSFFDESSEIAKTPSSKKVSHGKHKIEKMSMQIPNLEPVLRKNDSMNLRNNSKTLHSGVFEENSNSDHESIVIETPEIERAEAEDETDESSLKMFLENEIQFSNTPCDSSELDEIPKRRCETYVIRNNSTQLDFRNDDSTCSEQNDLKFLQLELFECNSNLDHESPRESGFTIESQESDRSESEHRNSDSSSTIEVKNKITSNGSPKLDEISIQRCGTYVIEKIFNNSLNSKDNDYRSYSASFKRKDSKFLETETFDGALSKKSIEIKSPKIERGYKNEDSSSTEGSSNPQNDSSKLDGNSKKKSGTLVFDSSKHDENSKQRSGQHVMEKKSNDSLNSSSFSRKDSEILETETFDHALSKESIEIRSPKVEPEHSISTKGSKTDIRFSKAQNDSSKHDENSKQRSGPHVMEKKSNDSLNSSSFSRKDSEILEIETIDHALSKECIEMRSPKVEPEHSISKKVSETDFRFSKAQNDSSKPDGNPKRCGTYVIKKSPNSRANHRLSSECLEGKPLEKRRKTDARQNQCEINDSIDSIEKNEDSAIGKEMRRIYEKYVNDDFSYDSDATVAETTREKIQNFINIENESNLNGKRGIENRIRRKMSILKKSTDTLISSSETTLMSSQSSIVLQSQNREIRTLKKNVAISGTSSFLPQINSELPVKSVEPRINGKSELPRASYWERAEKVVRGKLMSHVPAEEEIRILKRNPKILNLPPVNPTNPSNSEQSDNSEEYDPFLAAERQMNELFSDTSDQSVTDSQDYSSQDYSSSHEPIQAPLSHSSAFVQFPSILSPSVKRESVIAPPSEFDDFTSDFSSDSTETNSTSRETRLNSLNAQTPKNVADKSKPSPGCDPSFNQKRGKPSSPSAPKSRKAFVNVSQKIIRPTVTRSFSVRVPSAPKPPERKNSASSAKKSAPKSRDFATKMSRDDFEGRSGSNMSLSSILSSEMDLKRSNSVFDELMSSFEDDGSSFPSLKSFLKSDSLNVSSPLQGSDNRNATISDEGLSSPDSYKRQDHGKLSADSAYSSLNRKSSNHGRSASDAVSRYEEEERPSRRREADLTSAKSKMSKFCHECGYKFPTTAKFCCECGVKRLTL